MSNKLLKITFAVVLVTALVAVEEVLEAKSRNAPRASDTAIVRLYRPVPGGGMIKCSGTVINATHIATAAHCLVPTEYDFMPPIIEIRTSNDLVIGVTAQIESYDQRTDLGMLFGDFSTLMARGMVSGAEALNKAYKDHNITICGYPMGGDFTCSKALKCNNSFFKFSCKGFAYPGMSGGPVIDTNTGKLIGVITAVQDDQVILSPLVEVWKDLGITSDSK